MGTYNANIGQILKKKLRNQRTNISQILSTWQVLGEYWAHFVQILGKDGVIIGQISVINWAIKRQILGKILDKYCTNFANIGHILCLYWANIVLNILKILRTNGVHIVKILDEYCANILQILYKCCANIVIILCQHCANIVGIID